MPRNSKNIHQTCSFTGHRPTRLSFGFDESDERCIKLKTMMSEQITALIAGGVTDFRTGMALGVDTWAASIVLELKKENPNIRLLAVLPHEKQADSWTVTQREVYFDTLAQCADVVTLHKRYTHACMFERNRYLVDHAEHLLAVYDGTSKGGTAYTVRYGEQKKRRIIFIHPDTLDVTHSAGSGIYLVR